MTPQEAAQWMVDELTKRKVLDQESAAWQLTRKGKSLTYQNDSGNLAISKPVLAAFNKLTKGDDVVWSRSERQWRFRRKYDRPGRMQD
ncbi:DUF6953 family protein [Phaeobacter inhibens]|uniref:DUF6953 family protein n=1 Tax=Phaeobacter inhibens TaxID=221822 RepID=UPI000C998331|nr:hypothetical protein [Phaeobacter inhibens]AUQ72532.1 hypothetical protein PhaeoP54_03700 [Phaeobacter inhibens]